MLLRYLCLAIIIGHTVTASIANVYIAQVSAGSADGSSCGNADAVTFFNTSGNWGAGAGQIGSDTVVHLCGTLTTNLTWQGNGTSGHPVVLDGTGATMNSAIIIGVLSYWTLQNLTWSTSYHSTGVDGTSITIDLQGSTNGLISNITCDVDYVNQCVYFQQSSGATSLSHDITLQNSFMRNSANAVAEQEDLIDTEGSYNITITGNYFEMRATSNCASCHDDCIQTYEKGGGSAGPPHDWTISYNEFVMNTTQASNRSWNIIEQMGTGNIDLIGNLYVGLNGASMANGIAMDNNTSGMVAHIYGNTIVQKAGASNNLFNLITPGTFIAKNNIVYSTDAGNELTGGGLTTGNRTTNLWFGSGAPSCTSTSDICSSDPLFTNFAGNVFTVQSGSPARNAGTNLGTPYNLYVTSGSSWPGPTTQFRPATYDIGIYQFGDPNQPSSLSSGSTFLSGSTVH